MAATFFPTGAYSNLTRLELEQLRRADFFAGGKALTVGDSGLPPEGVVGIGDVNAEPFLTDPTIILDYVFPITPPQQPGPGLATVTQVANVPSETVKWLGPSFQVDGTGGRATAATVWTDTTGVNFTLFVQVGDVLLIKPKLAPVDKNSNCVATVTGTVTASTLTLTNINNPTNTPTTQFDTTSAGTDDFEYVVVRPNAVQLFAMPGSGATGSEQTFLAVRPGSTLHTNLAPTIDQINADRILNLVPPQFALDATVDRSDAVFDSPAPRTSLDKLGYRIVLYPDNGLGTGPNLATPITAIDPIISTSIPINDQRMTIDFDAGMVRFSCEPSIGAQIKPTAGCINPTTGRLNLYAVYWANDLTLTAGNARGLYGLRSTNQEAFAPGRVDYDTYNNAWRLGSTNSTNAAFVRAPDLTEDPTGKTEFGAFDATFPRSFIYRAGASRWHFLYNEPASSVDDPSFQELVIQDKTAGTVGDGANPPIVSGDYVQTTTSTTPGMRDPSVGILAGLKDLYGKGYGSLHLKRGQYLLQKLTEPIVIPPGITVEGEGDTTVVKGYVNSTFKLGPNTPWGVYDPDYDQVNGYTNTPTTTFPFSATETIEGVDMAWNPTRRVWGVAHADTTLNAIFFNEVRPDGTTVLPGLGIQIKDSSQALFTGGGGTPADFRRIRGHYPRVAYAPSTDEYIVVWVEAVHSGSFFLPNVYLQVVHTTQLYPSVKLAAKYTHAQSPGNSDLPSVTADPSATGNGFGTAYFCLAYSATSAGGGVTVSVWDTGSGLAGTNYVTQNYPAVGYGNGYASSVDVAADDNSNFMVAWSEHDHPVIVGALGSINGSSQLSDTGVGLLAWNNFGNALNGNEKFFILYTPTVAAQGQNVAWEGYIAETPIAAGTLLTVKRQDASGAGAGNYATDAGPVQWAIVPGSHLHGALITNNAGSFSAGSGQTDYAGTFTATAGSQTVVTIPSQVGVITPWMTISLVVPPFGTPAQYLVQSVSAGSITLNSNYVGNPGPTDICSAFRTGAQFDYTLPTPGDPAGAKTVPTPRELDTVRLSYGGGQWLMAFQAYATTGWFSFASLPNFDGSINTSFPETAAALNNLQGTFNVSASATVPTSVSQVGVLVVGSRLIFASQPGVSYTVLTVSATNIVLTTPYTGVANPSTTSGTLFIPAGSKQFYRMHLSTCAVILGPNGQIADKIIPVSTGAGLSNLTWNTGDPNYETNARRDLYNSLLSLGTRGPSRAYPNLTEASPTAPALQAPLEYGWVPLLGARNTMMPWGTPNTFGGVLSATPPALIPDVTWTGSDWVVVSPVQPALQSDTGSYFTDGVLFYLTDATVYFGSGQANGIDGNFLRQTIPVGSVIYFPSVNAYGSIFRVVDEHTVVISSPPPVGLTTPTTNLAWYLVTSNTLGETPVGGVKNPGFRVSPEGKIIVSSSYLTFADEVLEGDAITPADDTYRARLYFSGTPGDTDTSPLNAWPFYGSSRIPYDVGFRGVGVGAPKGMNELSAGNPPVCAIAWGENFYGFIDREVSGVNGSVPPAYSNITNRTVFYRQSFGPFRNGLKNLHLDQAEYFNPNTTPPTTILNVRSRYPVFTRHGMPASSSGSFATDGFRNFFVAPGISGLIGSPLAQTNTLYVPYLDSYTTDAFGKGAIRTMQYDVTNLNNPSLGFDLQFMSDLATTSSAVSSTNPNLQAPVPPKPVVLWDGSRPVAFFPMSGPLGNGLQAQSYRHIFLAMATFDGGEGDAQPQTYELTFDESRNLTVAEVARISAGCGNVDTPPAQNFEPTTQIDAAFSGKNYAVLWCAGVNPGDGLSPHNLGFSTVGITLFTGGGPGSSAMTFALATDYGQNGGFSHPKILWDGRNFVATWVRGPSVSRIIQTVSMPEMGFGTGQITKQAVNAYDSLNNFVMRRIVGQTTNYVSLTSTALRLQPGDLIHITSAIDSAGQPVNILDGPIGTYAVVDIEFYTAADGTFERAIVQNLAGAISTINLGINAASGPVICTGFVTSGGVSDSSTMSTALAPWGNAQNDQPLTLTSTSSTQIVNTGSDVCRLGGLVYNEERDEYAVMYHSQVGSPGPGDPTLLAVASFKKGSPNLGGEVIIAQTTNGIHFPVSAMGWNGRHYLVVYTDRTQVGITTYDSTLRYVLLSPNFQIVEQGIIDQGVTLHGGVGTAIGFSPGSMPGPLYNNIIGQGFPGSSVQLRNVEVRWNNRMNRWVLSGSYLWSTDNPKTIGSSQEINFAVETDINNGNNVVSWADGIGGSTITLSAGSVYPQPGMRLAWVQAGVIVTQMTVISAGASPTSFIVDLSPTESAFYNGIAVAHTAVAYLLPREDVFCWTLGYSNPGVLVQDADETFFENVTFSGGVDIEEKYVRMATPIWQAASSPVAQLATFTQRRGPYYNHLFPTPALKTETLRLTNVRSRTRVKYGYGRIAGNPVFDRYTFNTANRRS